MSEVFLFAILVLASYRVWRLAGADCWPPSVWLRSKVRGSSYVHELVVCPWCSGSLLTFAIFALAAQHTHMAWPVAQAVAAAALVGLVGESLDNRGGTCEGEQE